VPDNQRDQRRNDSDNNEERSKRDKDKSGRGKTPSRSLGAGTECARRGAARLPTSRDHEADADEHKTDDETNAGIEGEPAPRDRSDHRRLA
jgi:hypothetical protein